MSKLFTRSAALILFLLLFFLCCKKKDGGQPVAGGSHSFSTLISSTEHHSGCTDSTQILYDTEGRISSTLRYNGCAGTAGQPLVSHKRFAYDAGRLFILDTSFMADKDTLTLDATLRILEVQHLSSANGSVSFIGKYTYTPEGLLKASTVHYSSNGSTDSTHYTFSNGNLIQASNGSETLQYTYYDDKSAPASAAVAQNGLSYGSAFFYKNANLLKEVKNQQGVVFRSYRYDFDGLGNVIRKLTSNGSIAGGVDTTTYRYTYPID